MEEKKMENRTNRVEIPFTNEHFAAMMAGGDA